MYPKSILFWLTASLCAFAQARDIVLVGGIKHEEAKSMLDVFENSVALKGLTDGETPKISHLVAMHGSKMEDIMPHFKLPSSRFLPRNDDTCETYQVTPLASFLIDYANDICDALADEGAKYIGGGLALVIDNARCQSQLCSILVEIGAANVKKFSKTEIAKDCKAGVRNIVDYCNSHAGKDMATDAAGFTTQIKASKNKQATCSSVNTQECEVRQRDEL